jgi:flagellar biosynthesis protein FlhA
LAAPSPQPRNLIDRIRDQGDFLLAGGVFGLMAIMIVPLPTAILDLLLAVSITASLLLFLSVLYVKKPVELSVFPTVILVMTVFRLALNVATTRLILLNGAQGSDAAGRIVEAFGHFVIGGNAIVGLVVFTILIVINFVVITKGAGRVAEVAARFTLDAMPGKQMAIDAELNSGAIDEKTARTKRAEIAREADFYGSMDGASKFVRGDAVAGIVILLVNAIGGALIGVLQQGMPLVEAIQVYTLLTIGDGLVSQVPALLLSMAAGLLVTRVTDTDERPLHHQVSGQLFAQPRVLTLLVVALACFAFIPGLRIPFLVLAGSIFWLSRAMAAEADTKPKSQDEPSVPTEARPEDLLPIEPLTVEVGLDLLYLVDDRSSGEFIQRIQRIRNQFAQDLGVILPPVHIRDNLRLDGGEYSIMLRGDEIGRGKAYGRQHLALDPGGTTGALKGIRTTDPVFNLPAYWIPDNMVIKAQAMGYTVVDVPTVLTTHFVELMHAHAHELFDGVQLSKSLERVSRDNPKLVDDLIPDPLSRQATLRIFRSLIREGVSVRDAQTILEAAGEYAGRTRDPDVLTEFVRQRLARHITKRFADPEGVLHYIGFASDAEDALLRGLQTSEGAAPSLALDPDVARRMFARVRELVDGYSGAGQPVVLCPPLVRGALRRMFERALPRVVVLSSAELLPTVQLERFGLIDLRPEQKKVVK